MLQAIDYRSKTAAEEFVASLRQTGFGVLRNHPLDEQRIQSIYRHWAAFFADDSKHEYAYHVDTQDGFFPASMSETAKGSKVKDIKEYYHIYPWGQIPEQLRDEILSYYNDASALAAQLLSWVEAHSPNEVRNGYSEPLHQMIEHSPNTLLRVLHYPPMSGAEEPGAIRAAAHEDINLLTILPASNEPGLQVKAKDGAWIDVPCDFGHLIVNIGDMLQEASGGYFPSTSHRVINPSGQASTHSRYSLPLFLHPRSEVILSERHTQASYLHERLVELGVI